MTATPLHVWKMAHGRCRTLKERFVAGKHGLSRGRGDRLGDQELDDLIAFVLSL